MKYSEFGKDSSLKNKLEEGPQKKIIGNDLPTELNIIREGQSKKEQEKIILNNFYEENKEGVSPYLMKILDSADHEKEEYDKKESEKKTNIKNCKEKNEKKFNSKENSSLKIYKIKSQSIEKEKKIKKQKNEKKIYFEKKKVVEKKFYLNHNFEDFELIEKIKGSENKENQNYVNKLNIKHAYPELFENFNFDFLNFEFIPKIAHIDDGDKVNLNNEEIFNISSNHSRDKQKLNSLNEGLTNYAVGYHPPFRRFVYYYSGTNYTNNI